MARLNISQFDGADTQGASVKWERWRRMFELYISSTAIRADKRKLALLLLHVGKRTREIYWADQDDNDKNEDVLKNCL